ncbi:MAG: hypothetical protein IPK63_08400 [Candidatus Competibacteraceae bacterium]|nr:hypothetical protein [Candidatus Competibacteraceae bacterium]
MARWEEKSRRCQEAGRKNCGGCRAWIKAGGIVQEFPTVPRQRRAADCRAGAD